MRLQIVDPDQKPIRYAQVYLDTRSDYGLAINERPEKEPELPNQPPPAQVKLYQESDAEGRVIWTKAPPGIHRFDIFAPRYERKEKVRVPADGAEHVISLQRDNSPSLQINGTVKDERGRPVPRFRIILGWPEPDYTSTNESTIPVWSGNARDWMNFAGGSFKFNLELSHTEVMFTAGCILKFEADGYEPFISRKMKPEEGKVDLDVTLKPSVTLLVSVLMPNGAPAIGADVGLVSAHSELEMIPGGFSKSSSRAHAGYLLRTDEEGRFKWYPDPTVQKIMVAHRDGFGEATPEQLAANQLIQLMPWGPIDRNLFERRQASIRSAVAD